MVIAGQTLTLFRSILDCIPSLVPAQALGGRAAPMAAEGPFLDPAAHPPDPGRAAIVSVIDFAIPFAHPLFTAASGHSRVASIWLMEAARSERRPDIAFGRELRGPQIDALRDPRDPHAAYRACGMMTPGGCFDMAHAASHGAAVAALAAGHDPGGGRGRDFPLLAVSLPRSVMADTSGSLAVLFIQAAVVFTIARARALAREMAAKAGRPLRPALVVNLSLGVTGGADDGTALLTRLQEAISAAPTAWELGPIFFVLPTGNHRQDRLRARLMSGQRIGWHVPPADPTCNAIEIWGARRAPMPRIEITAPNGQTVPVPLKGTGMGRIVDAKGASLARVVLQRRGGENGRPCLTIILPPTLPAAAGDPATLPGLWQLHLVKAGAAGCDLLVHRDDQLTGFRGQGRQSRLVEPGYAARGEDGRWLSADDNPAATLIRRNGTASTYATGRRQIRVGASLARPPGQISAYTGLLLGGLPGDITAPADAGPGASGMSVPGIAPASRQWLSGTSLSAPQVTRWLAEALADGRAATTRSAVIKLAGRARPPDLGLPRLPWRSGLDG